VSSVPRPVRPATAAAAARSVAHAPISTADRAVACPRTASIVASVPARRVAAEDGTSAAKYPESAK
jgi:hypothetical protein